MLKKSILLSTSVALALSVAAPSYAQTADDEIIVTATKRQQTLQEVPIAVTVTTGATIEKAQILDIIDFQEIRSTPYLPYEIMVQGNQALALRGRYRIAVHFPDTSMAGAHGFTKIMSSPGGIKKALEAVAGK